ncbi:MAG: hypothetical protein IKG40_02940 [Bacilli bacterium]|nr:hypothetical protein [Bacilli bacterium]
MSENIIKPIKRISFEEPKGVHIKALVIYLLILSLLSYFLILFVNDNNLIVLLSFIITIPLYLNFIKICLDSSRDVLIDVKDLFEIKKYSFRFFLYYTPIILMFYVLSIIFNYIGVFGLLLSAIITIYLLPIIIMMPFIFLDNTNISFKSFLMGSIQIMKNKRIVFYGILCSFILWFLLGFLTLGILYLWLIPYIMICMSYFYLSLKKEKVFKKEKSLSDWSWIILFFLFIIVINIISFKIYPDSFNDFKENTSIMVGGKNE